MMFVWHYGSGECVFWWQIYWRTGGLEHNGWIVYEKHAKAH